MKPVKIGPARTRYDTASFVPGLAQARLTGHAWARRSTRRHDMTRLRGGPARPIGRHGPVAARIILLYKYTPNPMTFPLRPSTPHPPLASPRRNPWLQPPGSSSTIAAQRARPLEPHPHAEATLRESHPHRAPLDRKLPPHCAPPDHEPPRLLPSRATEMLDHEPPPQAVCSRSAGPRATELPPIARRSPPTPAGMAPCVASPALLRYAAVPHGTVRIPKRVALGQVEDVGHL